MRKLISNLVLGLRVAIFALSFLAASPFILFRFGVDWIRDRIESSWPGNDRAQMVSSWIRLLAPFVFCIILIVVLCFATAWLQARYSNS